MLLHFRVEWLPMTNAIIRSNAHFEENIITMVDWSPYRERRQHGIQTKGAGFFGEKIYFCSYLWFCKRTGGENIAQSQDIQTGITAVTEEEPDVTTMEYVRNWFVKNIP